MEIPVLVQVFSAMIDWQRDLGVEDWGIASATLEDSFIRLCTGATGD